MSETDPNRTLLSRRRRSTLPVRIAAMAVLTLSLQIPIGMIDSTITERQARRAEAAESVTQSWGGAQTVRGPFLVIPYLRRWNETVQNIDGSSRTIARQSSHVRYLLPESLAIDARLNTETRRRGIFDIPLFVSKIVLDGSMQMPAASDFPADVAEIHWDRMTLAISLQDPRSIREEAGVRWNGQEANLHPGAGAAAVFHAGVHAKIALEPSRAAGAVIPFTIRLAVAGSDGFHVLPAGSETTVRISSPWANPSFAGAYLPVSHDVGADGFEAAWSVLQLARGFPASWKDSEIALSDLDQALIGVRLLSPVDSYATTERAVKYQFLFIFLTFGALFLIEILGGLHVHPMQYLMIGFALCLFYLLLLSLAEHVGFDHAYAVAATSITLLVTGYGRAVLGTRARTTVIGGLLAALYVYLFVLLQIQDYALLVGAIGLFVALAAVMFLTRRIDWYGLEAFTMGTTASPAGTAPAPPSV